MQVILSAPRPSDTAKFEGQILSIIISIILEILIFPDTNSSPLTFGDPEVYDCCFVNYAVFFVGELAPRLFFPAAIVVYVFVELRFIGDEPPLFNSFYLVSYT